MAKILSIRDNGLVYPQENPSGIVSIKMLLNSTSHGSIVIPAAAEGSYGHLAVATVVIPANTISATGWIKIEGNLYFTTPGAQEVMLYIGDSYDGNSAMLVRGTTQGAASLEGRFATTICGEAGYPHTTGTEDFAGCDASLSGIDWTEEVTLLLFLANSGAECNDEDNGIGYILMTAYKAA